MWRVGADLKASNDNADLSWQSALGLGKDYYQKKTKPIPKLLQNTQICFEHVDSFGISKCK